MKKIISLFQRNYMTDRLVRDLIVPGAEWVIAGEGVATRKFDGTCCMIKEGKLYKRYDVKKGREIPEGFMPAQDPDEITGHWPGWIIVDENNPSDKWHIDAFKGYEKDGTYELCGPKINGNPENFSNHLLIPHGNEILNTPRTFYGLKEYLRKGTIEGIVWHHIDGRMVKIKREDFGFRIKKPMEE